MTTNKRWLLTFSLFSAAPKTRVHLSLSLGRPNSDYINANYIRVSTSDGPPNGGCYMSYHVYTGLSRCPTAVHSNPRTHGVNCGGLLEDGLGE